MISAFKDFDRYLNYREFRIISLRSQGQTLEEVGLEFGVSRERIRQIEASILKKLKVPEISEGFKEDFEIIKKYLVAPINLKELSLKLENNDEVVPNIDTWELNLGLNVFNQVFKFGLENESIHYISEKHNSLNEQKKGFINFEDNCYLFSIKKLKKINFDEIQNYLKNNFINTTESFFNEFEVEKKMQNILINILEIQGLIKIVNLSEDITLITDKIFTSNFNSNNLTEFVHKIIQIHFNKVYESNIFSTKKEYFNCPYGLHIKYLVENIDSEFPARALEASVTRWIENPENGLIKNGNNNYGLRILNTTPKDKTINEDNLGIIVEVLETDGPLKINDLLIKIWGKNPDFFIGSLTAIINTESTIFKIDDNIISLKGGYDKKTENIPFGKIVELISGVLREDSPMTSHQIVKKLAKKNIYIKNSLVVANLRTRNLTFRNVGKLDSNLIPGSKINFDASISDWKGSYYEIIENSEKIEGGLSYSHREEIIKYYLYLLDQVRLNKIKSPSSLDISEHLIKEGLFIEAASIDLHFRAISKSLIKLGHSILENYKPSSVTEIKINTEILLDFLSN